LKDLRRRLAGGMVIPAHPLALTAERKLDERRQRALSRYYMAAGAGGLAVAVHTTQFAIRNGSVGLLRPVLEIAAETVRARDMLLVAGVCGRTEQAVREAELAASFGYHAALLSLGALADASIPELLAHAGAVAGVLPVFGFYLQPAVGGRVLPLAFWREFIEIENVVAVKIAPFNRYQTLDVVRALADSGRAREIALYTGNDDSIMIDLLTRFAVGGDPLRIVGGLLGHWAVWTSRAREQFDHATRLAASGTAVPADLLTLAAQITDANAALFDAANAFHGSIAGLHEILRRQGLLLGRWCLDADEDLSPGQLDEIERVCRQYPHLHDDDFVREHLDSWLK
jgi:dihydrodipicolinate synthase/N-acetylneuraminate lyase